MRQDCVQPRFYWPINELTKDGAFAGMDGRVLSMSKGSINVATRECIEIEMTGLENTEELEENL